jgi:serine/threonine protein kinase
LKEFKKAASVEPQNRGSNRVIRDYTDHEKLKEYTFGVDLGEGSFAKVKLATFNTAGQQVAVKIYELSKNSSEEFKKNLTNEVKMLQTLSHPNIVKLQDTFEGKWYAYLVLEYVGSSTLLDLVEKSGSKTMGESEAAYIFLRVAKALAYLHERNISHRDVKLDNVMVGRSGEVKVIDFGFSVKTKRDQKLSTFCGTPSYMAPEMLGRLSHLPRKVDVWAFGVCLFRVLVGGFPFKGTRG